MTRDQSEGAAAVNSPLLRCTHCNARISRRVTECPWCGAANTSEPAAGMRTRMTLGALLTMVAIGAVLFALMALSLK
jgi:primosomal protein N'